MEVGTGTGIWDCRCSGDFLKKFKYFIVDNIVMVTFLIPQVEGDCLIFES